jgi:hypothetical protein
MPSPPNSSIDFSLTAETDRVHSDSRSSDTVVDPSENQPIEQPWQRTRIRVPREDATLLTIPALAKVPGLIDANASLLNEAPIEIAGRPLASLRRETRQQALLAAAEFTTSLIGKNPDFSSHEQVLASGHQPELFHPGVWIKNFATSQLARQTASTGLNLIVDSDTIGSCRIRVPAGNRKQPVFGQLAFDTPREVKPWEEAKILDHKNFASFADRAASALKEFDETGSPVAPLIARVWPKAVKHAAKTGSLSESLSLVRILLERDFGHGNAELPVSRLCQLDSFSWFAADVLLRAGEFREVHNRTLGEYRKTNRIRSRTHPVPELKESAGWIESPFRVWRTGEAQRNAVFVRTANGRTQLSGSASEAGIFLDVDSQADCESLATRLSGLSESGIRFRTRALTTTIFARLCLADLFVHGIGGAKYDEMTDRILARFYGIRPPGFLTLSATAFLPIATPFDATPADAIRLRTMLRELQHNPQKHLADSQAAPTSSLVEQKQELIEEQHQADANRALGEKAKNWIGANRYRRFPQLNRVLASYTEPQQHAIQNELASVEQQLTANAVLQCREFSLCLYPAERIEKMLTELQEQLA